MRSGGGARWARSRPSAQGVVSGGAVGASWWRCEDGGGAILQPEDPTDEVTRLQIGVTEEVARGSEIKGEAVTGGADRGNQWSPAAPVGSKEQIEAGQGRGGHRRADRGHRRGLVAAA